MRRMCAHSCLTGVSVGGEGNQILLNITIMDSYKLICQVVSLHISLASSSLSLSPSSSFPSGILRDLAHNIERRWFVLYVWLLMSFSILLCYSCYLNEVFKIPKYISKSSPGNIWKIIPFTIKTVGSKYLLNSLDPEMTLWAPKSPAASEESHIFFALDGWETFTILPRNAQHFISVQLCSSETNCCYTTISFPVVLCESSVLFSAGFRVPATCSASMLSGMFSPQCCKVSASL